MSKRNESKSNPLQLRSPAINKNIESSNAKSVFSKSPSYDVVPVKSKLSEMMLGFDYSYKLSALCKYLFERLRNVINKYDELDHRREVIRKKKKAQKHNEVDITESDITPEPDSAVSKTGPYSIKFEKGSTNNIDEEVSIFMDHLDLNTKVFRKQIEKFYSLPERAEKLEKVENTKENNIFDNNILQRDELEENMYVKQMIETIKKQKSRNKNINDIQDKKEYKTSLPKYLQLNNENVVSRNALESKAISNLERDEGFFLETHK